MSTVRSAAHVGRDSIVPNTEPSPGESTAGKSTGANKPAARKTASRTAAEKTPAKAVKSAPAAKSSAPAAAKSAPASTVKEDPAPARQASAATAVVTDIEVRNPATGELVGTVHAESADAVAAKVRELRLYQPEWEAIGPEGRKEWLLKLQDWMIDHT